MSNGDWDRVAPLYVAELYRQARMCRSACDHVLVLGERFRTGKKTPSTELAELSAQAEQAISCAASIRNLLFGSPARRRTPQEVHELGTKRITWLADVLGNHDVPAISSVDARNDLEHFDERMDALVHDWLEVTEEHNKRPIGFDAVEKTRGAYGGTPYLYVRCYITDEATFVILDHDVHIPTLRGEAQRIEKATGRHIPGHTATWDTSGAAPQKVLLPRPDMNAPHREGHSPG